MTRAVALLFALTMLSEASFAQSRDGEATRPRAVIELFTSQGCSSCPPADKLMMELAKDPSLIVVSLPVDYWDYLGWKDTLADPAFSHRQRAYSAVRGDRQVYTPQAVVNGAAHAVGSERVSIDKAIMATKAKAAVLSVSVRLEKVDGGLKAIVGAAPGLSGHVWLLPVVRERSVQIGRGENTGRSITYVNVVRGVTRLGAWNGEAVSLDIPSGSLPGESEDVVVLLQGGSDKKPGMILGAARRSTP